MRNKIIIANWKMKGTTAEAIDIFKNVLGYTGVADIVICPPYTTLSYISERLQGLNISLGAQNAHYEKNGAYTGEISIKMLKEVNVKYCLVGHSERRLYFNETDDTVNKKTLALLNENMIPIICLGETLEDRESGILWDKIKMQVLRALEHVDFKDVSKLVLAYEPIWAIGTGKTATSSQAGEMCAYIREIVRKLYNEDVANLVRIIYGGSVDENSICEILNTPNIDGVLVGSKSLKPEFKDMLKMC